MSGKKGGANNNKQGDAKGEKKPDAKGAAAAVAGEAPAAKKDASPKKQQAAGNKEATPKGGKDAAKQGASPVKEAVKQGAAKEAAPKQEVPPKVETPKVEPPKAAATAPSASTPASASTPTPPTTPGLPNPVVEEALAKIAESAKSGHDSFPVKHAAMLAQMEMLLTATDKSRNLNEDRETGVLLFSAIAEKVKMPVAAYLYPSLNTLLAVIEDKKVNARVSKLATEAGKKYLAKGFCEYAAYELVPILLGAAQTSINWQVKVAALEFLESLAGSSPVEVDSLMPTIVPVVSAIMWDTKKEVKSAATKCLEACCRSSDNIDLAPFIPKLVRSIVEPEEVIDCVQSLASTTFVQAVKASALSITVPLLERGFKERTMAVKRQCAVITENMAKLVNEPGEVAPFLPVLGPLLERCKEEVSDPECRSRCDQAYAALMAIGSAAETTNSDADKKKQTVANADKTVRPVAKQVFGDALSNRTDQLVNFIGEVTAGLRIQKELSPEEWKEVTSCLMGLGEKNAQKLSEDLRAIAENAIGGSTVEVMEDQQDDAEVLCDTKFSLAYGTKILLNNARLTLKRGRRYAIVAPKSAGKTTLLKAISNYQVEGFPTADVCKTVFVEDDIQGSTLEMDVVEFVLHTLEDEKGVTKESVISRLESVGFDSVMRAKPISSLSGGWRIKTSLARAMLRNPDILLLDEPTNHLDVLNVTWVVEYLTGPSCTEVTSLIVSHDTKFIDRVATNVIHFSPSLKLDYYVGALDAFVAHHPEAKAYYELGNTDLVFKLPQPAPLDGVKSKGKPVMTMTDVSFSYPGQERPQLEHVTLRLSMASRVACVGANGAGKSTMIKLLTGELVPSSGNVTKHPMLRFAYIAQHAFHHIQSHLNKTPNEYIRWRYADGDDKEALRKDTAKISPEELKIMKTPLEVVYEEEDGKRVREKRVVEKLVGRRKEGKELHYEVKFENKSNDQNLWFDRDYLIEKGFKKLVEDLDRRKLAADNAYTRAASAKNIEEHLMNVGLDAEIATHTRISALSGGQKVKVVLAACTWYQPHVIILDEPTNYLDREALGALANALISFEGGVCLITHNKEFAEKVCRETWVTANNRVDVKGDPEWEKYAKEAVELGFDQTDQFDAFGNKLEVNTKKTPATVKPKDRKKMERQLIQMIQSQSEMTEFELACCDEWKLWDKATEKE
jgi:elongation factor 3